MARGCGSTGPLAAALAVECGTTLTRIYTRGPRPRPCTCASPGLIHSPVLPRACRLIVHLYHQHAPSLPLAQLTVTIPTLSTFAMLSLLSLHALVFESYHIDRRKYPDSERTGKLEMCSTKNFIKIIRQDKEIFHISFGFVLNRVRKILPLT